MFEGSLRFSEIIQENINRAKTEEGLSGHSWGLRSGYLQHSHRPQLKNLGISDPHSPAFAHVSIGTLFKLGEEGVLKKEDGITPYSTQELLQLVLGLKYEPELIDSVNGMVFGKQSSIDSKTTTPYAKGVAMIRGAMGDRTVEEFRDTIPYLGNYLKGHRLGTHDIALVMGFLGLSDRLPELYEIYGYSINAPMPKREEQPGTNGKAAPKNGNGKSKNSKERQ